MKIKISHSLESYSCIGEFEEIWFCQPFKFFIRKTNTISVKHLFSSWSQYFRLKNLMPIQISLKIRNFYKIYISKIFKGLNTLFHVSTLHTNENIKYVYTTDSISLFLQKGNHFQTGFYSLFWLFMRTNHKIKTKKFFTIQRIFHSQSSFFFQI